MANGNTQIIREMKKIVEEGKPLDIDTRDRMLFSAIIDIYEKLEKFMPIFTFYQVGMYFASAIGVAIIAFIGALLTGQIEVNVK